ncbi:MAG: hypothetical protein AAGG07_02320 [Planctomycetota bacterium]
MPPNLPKPICAACGYDLTGATESAVCPECGKPLVEVLTRATGGVRHTSERRVFGIPLYEVAQGPTEGEKVGRARAIIAVGDDAIGLIAIGGMARGGIAIGGMTAGVVSIGGMSVGLGAATGGLVISGLLSFGGAGVSAYAGFGGVMAAHVGKAAMFFQIW